MPTSKGIGKSPMLSRFRGGYGVYTTALNAAIVTAGGSLSALEKSAMNDFETGLTTYSLLNKGIAFYPMIGSSAISCSFNFFNPSLYRITFNGGWTFASTGATSNGTNGYADNGLNCNSVLSISSNSSGRYIRNNVTGASYIYGTFDGVTAVDHNIGAGTFINGAPTGIVSYTPSPTTKFLIMSRESTILLKGYRDNTLLGTNTVAQSALPSLNYTMAARNTNGVYTFYAPYENAGEWIGLGLTPTEVGNLTTLINNFQTTLGRNV